MANKIPLKIESGQIMQFQAGDTISSTIAPGSGGPGGATITRIEQDLSATPARSGRFTVVDAAVTAASYILIKQATGPYTGKGTCADEASMDSITCYAEPLTGTFVVYWEVRPVLTQRPVQFQSQTRETVTTAFNASDEPKLRFESVLLGKAKGNVKFDYILG
jgi:hypothetical protein